MMRTLHDAVAELLADPADVVLARSIFETADAAEIGARVDSHVRAELGQGVAGCALFTQSVGAVFVLSLSDGREVAVKIHPPPDERWRGVDGAGLRAVYAAQAELAAAGVRCAQVVRGPAPFGGGFAAIMTALSAPAASDDPHAPSTMRALAREQARIAALGRGLPMRDELPRATLPSSLYPQPHNALFDFSRPGGEWIDARARAARTVLDGEPPLAVMHSDVSCANVRVAGGEVVAVYDMDSVCLIDEVRCVANAAIHFTYAGDPPWTWPSRDQAKAYIVAFEEARGAPFSAAERRRLDAAAIYALAYTARCELSLGDGGGSDGVRALLADAPDDYLS